MASILTLAQHSSDGGGTAIVDFAANLVSQAKLVQQRQVRPASQRFVKLTLVKQVFLKRFV